MCLSFDSPDPEPMPIAPAPAPARRSNTDAISSMRDALARRRQGRQALVINPTTPTSPSAESGLGTLSIRPNQ